jgi:hypothetical protein
MYFNLLMYALIAMRLHMQEMYSPLQYTKNREPRTECTGKLLFDYVGA